MVDYKKSACRAATSIGDPQVRDGETRDPRTKAGSRDDWGSGSTVGNLKYEIHMYVIADR